MPIFSKEEKRAVADRDYSIIRDYISRNRREKEKSVSPGGIQSGIPPSYEDNMQATGTGIKVPEAEFPEIPEKYYGEEILGIVSIPSISVSYPVLEGAEDTQLSLALGHLPCSARVGEAGNCVIAGHTGSIDGDFFNSLNRLSIGDNVFILRADGEFFSYKVEEIYVMEAELAEECLDGCGEAELTLITCAGGGAQRLICRCVPLNN